MRNILEPLMPPYSPKLVNHGSKIALSSRPNILALPLIGDLKG